MQRREVICEMRLLLMRCYCSSILRLFGILLVFLPALHNAAARPLDEVKASGYLRVFVYENFHPYSYKENGVYKGIDVEIGRLLAERLGVKVNFFMREADENIDDDLRINVWKGHFIGGGVADVMMHVPYDKELGIRNNLAVLFAPYYTERLSLLVDPAQVGAAETLAVFMHYKIGAELDTIADIYLSSPFTAGGRIREKIVHYRDFAAAMKGFKNKEVAGLLAPRAQAEAAAAMAGRQTKVIQPPMPGLGKTRWNVGLAVKHNSRDLAYALGDIIKELRKSGQLARVFKRYGASYFVDFLD